MKKTVTVQLSIVIIVSMIAVAVIAFHLQIKSAKEAMYSNAELRINQVSEILATNDEDIVRLRENLEEDYFIRAKAAAYIIQNQPEVIGNLEEIRKIAALLRVDELHLFDTEGRLFDGSEPEYYDYTFDSGEQIGFFRPMLSDYNLQLCQEVMPNTAEGKMMQYIAVWREDRQGIVQIGMEPIRLLEAMEKNELSHIFNLMTTEEGITIFAVDLDTGMVSGTTDRQLLGMPAENLGLDLRNLKQDGSKQIAELIVEGRKNYCVMEAVDTILICVSGTHEKLYENVPDNMSLIFFSLCFLFLL